MARRHLNHLDYLDRIDRGLSSCGGNALTVTLGRPYGKHTCYASNGARWSRRWAWRRSTRTKGIFETETVRRASRGQRVGSAREWTSGRPRRDGSVPGPLIRSVHFGAVAGIRAVDRTGSSYTNVLRVHDHDRRYVSRSWNRCKRGNASRPATRSLSFCPFYTLARQVKGSAAIGVVDSVVSRKWL